MRGCGFGVALAVCLLAATACSDGHDGFAGSVELPISGGDPAPGDTGGVLVVDVKNINMCSGSLIAPNLVLTSRQCMAKLGITAVDCATSTFAPPAAPTTVKVVADASFSPSDSAKLKSVSEIHVPVSTDKVCGGDIALVVLTDPLEATVAAQLTPRLDADAVPGEEFSALGFGPPPAPLTRKKRSGLIVSCVGSACPSTSGEVVAGEWGGDMALESIDAGGPALDSGGLVFGVASRGNAGMAAYTSLTAHKQLIVDTAIHAASVGGYPVPAWAGGASDGGVAGAGGSGGGSAGTAGGTGATAAGGSSASSAGSSDDGGCSLSSGDGSPSRWLLVVLAALLGLRRR